MNEIAYYPGETDLFAGEIDIEKMRDEEGRPVHNVAVANYPDHNFSIISRKELPLRTRHEAYFTRLGNSAIVTFNVDLELEPQPTIEDIARAVLATEIES